MTETLMNEKEGKNNGFEGTAFFEPLKFLGSICIIGMHYCDCVGKLMMSRRLELFSRSPALNYISYVSYTFVEMFFLFSGVVFVKAYKKRLEEGERIADFIGRRYKRFFPGIAITTTIMFLMNLLLYLETGALFWAGHLDLRKLFFDYLCAGTAGYGTGVDPINSPLWYIAILLQCYLLAALLVRREKKTGKQYCYLIPVLLGIYVIVSRSHYFLFNIQFARGCISFFIGIIIGNNIDKIREGISKTKRMILCVILFCILIFFCIVFVFTVSDPYAFSNNYGAVLPYALLFYPPLVILLLCSKAVNKICDNKILRYLGRISYGMYIWNFPLMITFCYLICISIIPVDMIESPFGFIGVLFAHVLAGVIMNEAGKFLKNSKQKKTKEKQSCASQ